MPFVTAPSEKMVTLLLLQQVVEAVGLLKVQALPQVTVTAGAQRVAGR